MLKWLQLIMQFFPTILQVVKAIQDTIPDSAPEIKKAVAMVALNPTPEQAPAVSSLTDQVVAAMKGKDIPSTPAL